MKILGISGSHYNESFIAEISTEEMMDLVGDDNARKLGCGDKIRVAASIRRLVDIDKQSEQRAKIALQLRSMAELIETAPPIVIPAEQPKEGGDA